MKKWGVKNATKGGDKCRGNFDGYPWIFFHRQKMGAVKFCKGGGGFFFAMTCPPGEPPRPVGARGIFSAERRVTKIVSA